MKQTIILDSSQLATFDECPQLWGYSYKDSISKVDAAPNDAMVMGTYGHRLLDIYYKNGGSDNMVKAIEAALKFDPDDETCLCTHLKIEHTPYDGQSYENSRLVCNKCRCGHESPKDIGFFGKPFPLSKDQRKLVQDRFTIHCYTYSQNDFKPKSKDHVEVGFSNKLYEDDNVLYILEGRIDCIGTQGGQEAILDHKFQMRRRDLYKGSIQARNYTLVTGCPLFIFNYIRLTAKIDKDTLSRQVSVFSHAEIEWWRGKLIKMFDEVALAERSSILTNRWSACSGKYGYECQYTQLCTEPNTAVKLIKTEQLYHKKEVWRPW